MIVINIFVLGEIKMLACCSITMSRVKRWDAPKICYLEMSQLHRTLYFQQLSLHQQSVCVVRQRHSRSLCDVSIATLWVSSSRTRPRDLQSSTSVTTWLLATWTKLFVQSGSSNGQWLLRILVWMNEWNSFYFHVKKNCSYLVFDFFHFQQLSCLSTLFSKSTS